MESKHLLFYRPEQNEFLVLQKTQLPASTVAVTFLVVLFSIPILSLVIKVSFAYVHVAIASF